MLFEKKVERVILSRPAVEAGERLGFLPGDMKDKVDPYLRPQQCSLRFIWFEKYKKKMGEIEIAPLAFMRGRTLKILMQYLMKRKTLHLLKSRCF